MPPPLPDPGWPAPGARPLSAGARAVARRLSPGAASAPGPSDDDEAADAYVSWLEAEAEDPTARFERLAGWSLPDGP